jgi:hypothetical protein
MTARMESSPCTNCGKLCDAAAYAGAGEATPSPGDFTICFYCGHLMLFDDRLHLRDPTDAEVVEAAGHSDVNAAYRALGAHRKNR